MAEDKQNIVCTFSMLLRAVALLQLKQRHTVDADIYNAPYFHYYANMSSTTEQFACLFSL